jgi:hypothetical protein
VNAAEFRSRLGALHDEVVALRDAARAYAEEDRVWNYGWQIAAFYLDRARRAIGTADREARKSADPRDGVQAAPIPRERRRPRRRTA